MGDGSLSKKLQIATLHTQSFSKECNLNMIKELNQKFDLNCTLGTHNKGNRKYYVINIPKKSLIKLNKLVNKYVIESMKYKIEL